MKDILRPIQQEPEHHHVDDDRDPEDLAQTRPRALVLQLIHHLQQFMAFQVLVLLAPAITRRLRRSASGTGWDFCDGHSKTVSGCRPGFPVSSYSLILRPKPCLLDSRASQTIVARSCPGTIKKYAHRGRHHCERLLL